MHLATVHTRMLSELEILVWALNRGLWGPGLRGTCWGLELVSSHGVGEPLPETGPHLLLTWQHEHAGHLCGELGKGPRALPGSAAKGLCRASPSCPLVTVSPESVSAAAKGEEVVLCRPHAGAAVLTVLGSLRTSSGTPAPPATWQAQSFAHRARVCSLV